METFSSDHESEESVTCAASYYVDLRSILDGTVGAERLAALGEQRRRLQAYALSWFDRLPPSPHDCSKLAVRVPELILPLSADPHPPPHRQNPQLPLAKHQPGVTVIVPSQKVSPLPIEMYARSNRSRTDLPMSDDSFEEIRSLPSSSDESLVAPMAVWEEASTPYIVITDPLTGRRSLYRRVASASGVGGKGLLEDDEGSVHDGDWVVHF